MIKILWLYKFIKDYNFDHHLHMSYADFISKEKDVTLKAYGPDIHISNNNLSFVHYDDELTLKQLHKMYDFDVIIVNTKSRCFENYNPFKKTAIGCWLPKDFKFYNNCPKIVIEEDYHYETDDDWYAEMNVDLILQRHYSQTLRQQKIAMRFLPFSVNADIFNCKKSRCIYQDRSINVEFIRKKKIAFVGNSEDSAYKYRKMAILNLSKKNMIDNFSGSKKVDIDYIQVLRQYMSYISCGSIYDICAAKNFEIMASGGLLFTNKFLGIEKLFPEETYCSYENDGSDIIEKATKILNDNHYRESTIVNARKHIESKHTHQIRTKELINIIGDLK